MLWESDNVHIFGNDGNNIKIILTKLQYVQSSRLPDRLPTVLQHAPYNKKKLIFRANHRSQRNSVHIFWTEKYFKQKCENKET
jgi:hypothetical protein